MTIILVSHSMEDVARYADRLIVMNHGQKVFDGAPKECIPPLQGTGDHGTGCAPDNLSGP